jgi:hypothetical protein
MGINASKHLVILALSMADIVYQMVFANAQSLFLPVQIKHHG